MPSQKEVKYNFDFAMQFNRWSMQFLGLWPFDDSFSKLRYSLTLLFIGIIIIPTTIKCFMLTNFFKEIEAIFVNINLISTFIKIIFFGLSMQNLKPLIKDMIVDWDNTLLSKESKNLMISNSKRGRMLNALCIICMYLPLTIFVLRPLIGLGQNDYTEKTFEKSFPCRAYYPIDTQKSPNYEIVYISQVISMFYVVTAATGINCFLTIIVFHLCGQLQIVALDVKYITSPENTPHSKSINPQGCKCLHCIVERHIKLIRDSEIIESSFHIMILMEAVITVISLCIQSYSVLVVSPATDFSGTLANILYFIAPTALVFLYCYIGEHLIKASTNIGHQVYDINWFECKPALVRAMMLIIIRSQKQLEITAGKFFHMSLHAFKKILVSALSYATVLLASSRNHH